MPDAGLRFDRAVPPGGYVWWYVDGLSDDGQYGLTAIAFVGSVFSPYYARARRRGAAIALNHCAFNVALYGPRAARWAMTERGARQVARESTRLAIGASAMHWDGTVLTLTIDERCAPVPRRLKGVIRVHPSALANRSFTLDEAGRHHWTPYAPRARLEVCMTEPALAWCGSGYLDSNAGAAPLEDAFIDWTWSRAELGGRTLVLYDVRERSSRQASLALEFAADGAVRGVESPPQVILPPTGWRVPRRTRADTGSGARVVKTLEDSPFYSRSLLETRLLGAHGFAIHEALDLDRFRAPWVQCLLPFRMPRIAF